jgi:hypothetical protein
MANTKTKIESKTEFYTNSTQVHDDEANHIHVNKNYVEWKETETPRGLDRVEDFQGNIREVKIDKAPSSMNPYFNLRIKDLDGNNYPVHDEDSAQKKELFESITPKKLIENPRGASFYQPDDFLYLKNLGKIGMNRMITLRRFAHPTFDDIFNPEYATEPDICRLITFADQETNKFSEVLSFSCGLKWKELQSVSESGSMEGNQNGIDGIMGKALRFVDPKFGQEAIGGRNRLAIDPQHDNNRVYGPVDSIASTTIRDVGLNFEQNIELTFTYKMKSINGVNQKAAFIDLLSNIILMCTNDGKFWGGARYWIGPQPSKYMNDLKNLEPKNWDDFLNRSTSGMKSLLGSIAGEGNAKDMLKKIANNAMNLALGRILNTLGRPGIPVMNSLLVGNPVGEWHLTIGNPLNPILVAGDLIMENSTITFGDELGYDDFPTEINVTCQLKHPKARDRAGIESMFNAGKGRTYMKPEDVFNSGDLIDSVNGKTLSQKQGENKLNNKFGGFSQEAVLRNSPAVWSFLKNEK